MRDKLVATFNSGFKLADSGGGFVSGGHTYAPMKTGQATIVRYRDGHDQRHRLDRRPGRRPDVMYARQNLPLIVNGGRLNPNLSDGPEWGATLGNAIRVWRSGVGIDRHGNLIYAAADDQTVASLAEILNTPAPCARWSSTSTPTGRASSPIVIRERSGPPTCWPAWTAPPALPDAG